MNALLGPLKSTADSAAAVIMDARLAISPGGLILGLRLARLVPVWLTRTFWELVDRAYVYGCHPELLGKGIPRAQRTGAVDALAVWNNAWLNGSLNGAFHWIGDARRESALPTCSGSDVISRYEALAAALNPLGRDDLNAPVDLLSECAKEALALAAALAASSPVILTRAAATGRGRPLLCADGAGVAVVHDPPKERARREWTDQALPSGVKSMIGQLHEVGVGVAAVYALAPAAVCLPSNPPSGVEEAPLAEAALAPPLWSGAHIFWHRLG